LARSTRKTPPRLLRYESVCQTAQMKMLEVLIDSFVALEA
jgi:hypothetical protein